MQYEIQRGETVYVLKLKEGELQYLTHIAHRDSCDCEGPGCTPPSQFNIELMEIADKEGIQYC